MKGNNIDKNTLIPKRLPTQQDIFQRSIKNLHPTLELYINVFRVPLKNQILLDFPRQNRVYKTMTSKKITTLGLKIHDTDTKFEI